ncbi:unnamed protein product [Ectocarpus fasciculatus]
MVLQRDAESKLFGYSAAAGAKISVSFSIFSEAFSVVATSSLEQAADGGFRWVAVLPPMPGALTEYTVNITSSAGENAVLNNVVFGDVYVCSGQSNMQFSVPGDFDAEAEIGSAEDYPFLRVLSVGQDYTLPQVTEPLDDLYFLDMPWSVGSSASVDGGSWGYRYSAICWFFGKNIFDSSLQRSIPVGLVSDNWGGTIIEAWSPPSVIEKCGGSTGEVDVHRVDFDPNPHTAEDFDPNAYSILYNTMVYPIRDMAVKGVLWYQGESNVMGGAATYPCLQDAMVQAWRTLVGSDFSFLYVQLSTWDNGGNGALASFRSEQTKILSITENVAMITAADLGDPESPYDPIHPRNKTEVGRRLALAARSLVYGEQDIPFLGPILESISSFEDDTYGWSVRLSFEETSCGTGIHLEAAQECPASSAEAPGGCGEVILEYPGVRPSTVIQVRAVVVVSGEYSVELFPVERMARKPINVYYCLGDYPLLIIYNSIGVPTLPFTATVP